MDLEEIIGKTSALALSLQHIFCVHAQAAVLNESLEFCYGGLRFVISMTYCFLALFYQKNCFSVLGSFAIIA